MRDGALFYVIQVVPQRDSRNFNRAFSNAIRSIRISN